MNNEWLLIEGKFEPLLTASVNLLQKLSSEYSETGSAGIRSKQPLQLSQIQGELQSPYARVRSHLPCVAPKTTGVLAQMLGRKFEGLKNLAQYDMGNLHFEILSEQGQVLESVMVPIGAFKTYEYGRPHTQVLEYVATLCDIDLTPHGFRCFRYMTQILFQGLPDKPGLNLRLVQQEYPPQMPIKGEKTDFGITPGMCTLDRSQIAGKAGVADYGHYQINGQSIHLLVSQSQARDLEGIQKFLLKQLNGFSSATQVKASFDVEHHLLLTHLKPGSQQSIVVRALPTRADAEVELLPLNLPEGVVSGADNLQETGPSTDFGKLCLNQVPIELGRFKHLQYTSETAAQEILRKFNQVTINTGVLASLDQERHLVLQSVRDELGISITQLTSSENLPVDNHPLGLQEGYSENPFKLWQSLSDGLKQFVKAFNQFSTAIRSSVMQATDVQQQALLKELESQLYEALLTPLELEGLDLKQPFNEILGVQLLLNDKLLHQQWQQEPHKLKHYFEAIVAPLRQMGQKFAFSEPAPPAALSAAASLPDQSSGLNIQARPYPVARRAVPPKPHFSDPFPSESNETSTTFDHKI